MEGRIHSYVPYSCCIFLIGKMQMQCWFHISHSTNSSRVHLIWESYNNLLIAWNGTIYSGMHIVRIHVTVLLTACLVSQQLRQAHMAWVWGFTDCLMCLGVCVCTRVWSDEGLCVQLVIFLPLIALSAAAGPLIGWSRRDIQCSDTLGNNEWLIIWLNDRHTKNKCLFRADLSLIHTPCVSLSERFMLKMTLLAWKKKKI